MKLRGIISAVICLKPGKGPSPEPNHVGTLLSDFQPLELWEINASCLNNPASGNLLKQPKLTKTLGLKLKCRQGCAPSGRTWGEPLLCLFQLLEATCISKLVISSSISKDRCIASSNPCLWLWFSCHSLFLMNNFVIIWTHPINSG